MGRPLTAGLNIRDFAAEGVLSGVPGGSLLPFFFTWLIMLPAALLGCTTLMAVGPVLGGAAFFTPVALAAARTSSRLSIERRGVRDDNPVPPRAAAPAWEALLPPAEKTPACVGDSSRAMDTSGAFFFPPYVLVTGNIAPVAGP